jgi:hypothetical protein
MDWTAAVDGYCERLGPGLWAEPLNLVSNLAFLVSAIVVWRRCAGLPEGRLLATLIFAIFVGSSLFHALANRWSGLADVLPIALFILVYVFLAARDFLRLRPVWAAGVALAFIPYAAATVPLFARIPGLGSSAGYAPVPVLILVFALLVLSRHPRLAGGLALGALILLVSLTFRTIDGPLCAAWPSGTHYLWHGLNGLMLAWMAEVWRRHRLEGLPAGR